VRERARKKRGASRFWRGEENETCGKDPLIQNQKEEQGKSWQEGNSKVLFMSIRRGLEGCRIRIPVQKL